MYKIFALIIFFSFLGCKKAPVSTPVTTKLVVMKFQQTLRVNGVYVSRPYQANLEVGKTYTCIVGGSTNMGIYLDISVDGIQHYYSGNYFGNTFTYEFILK